MQRTCVLSDNEGKIILEELDFKFNTYNNLHTFKNLCEKLNRKSNLFSFRFEYLQNKSPHFEESFNDESFLVFRCCQSTH